MNYQKMTKKQLEEYGRTIGIELDLRLLKTSLIATLKAAEKAAPKKAAPKKAAPKKAAPKKQSMPTVVDSTDDSFWGKLKNFFNLD
jgi:hypothetical protein